MILDGYFSAARPKMAANSNELQRADAGGARDTLMLLKLIQSLPLHERLQVTALVAELAGKKARS